MTVSRINHQAQWATIDVSNSSVRVVAALLGLLVSFGAPAQSLRVSLMDGEGEPVGGAVIELLLPDGQGVPPEPLQVKVDQVDKEFVSRVTAIPVGSQVSFPNSDDILHHVYSFSPANTFNIPLYGRGELDDYYQTFPEPGVVEIGCNIHDWMLAYIYVGESGHLAVSGAQGQAELTAVPTGEFTLKIWHPRLDAPDNSLTRPVSINASGVTELKVSLSLQRERRIRRAPSASGQRYR